MRIGLGVVTYNRPYYFQQAIQAVSMHLLDRLDTVLVYNDGTNGKPQKVYEQVYAQLPRKIQVHHAIKNKGVAAGKNWLLKQMMDDGCDWLFLAEDDVVPLNRGAIIQYIATSVRTGCHNLMFAHHGDGNAGGPRFAYPDYELYGNCVGAWTLYTRQAIETVGYMDEHFVNAWEHVEHTYRIIKAGLAPPMWSFMDVVGSTQFLQEIPGSIETSSIRQNQAWKQRMVEGLEYWKSIETKKDWTNSGMQNVVNKLNGLR